MVKNILLHIILFVIVSLPINYCLSVGNPYSMQVVSVKPHITCLAFENYWVKSSCDDAVYIYNKDGSLSLFLTDKTQRRKEFSEGPLEFYDVSSRFFWNVCETQKEYILPDGLNWCDYNKVTEFFKNNVDEDYLLLGKYEQKFKMGDQDFSLSYNVNYSRPYELKPTNSFFGGPEFWIFLVLLFIFVGYLFIKIIIRNGKK